MSNQTSIRNIMESRKAHKGYELPEAIENGSLTEAYEFQSSLVREMISAEHSGAVGASNSLLTASLKWITLVSMNPLQV